MRRLLACTVLLAGCQGPTSSVPAPELPDLAIADPPSTIVSRSTDTLWETQPALAASSSTAVACWTGFASGNHTRVACAFSLDAGATWLAPSRIATPGDLDSRAPSLAADAQGNFWLTWAGLQFPPFGTIYLAEAAAGSTTFGAAVQVNDPSGPPCAAPHVALTAAGRPFLSYTRAGGVDLAGPASVVALSSDGRAFSEQLIVGGEGTTGVCAAPVGTRIASVVSDGPFQDHLHVSDDGAHFATGPATSVFVRRNAAGHPSCVADAQGIWVMDGGSRDQIEAGTFPPAHTLLGRSDGITVTDSTALERDLPNRLPPFLPAFAEQPDGALEEAFYVGDLENGPAQLRHSRLPAGATRAVEVGIIRSNLVMSTSPGTTRWLGDRTAVAVTDRALLVAYVDNREPLAHVALFKEAR